MADTNLRYKLSLENAFSKTMDNAIAKTKTLDGTMNNLDKRIGKVNNNFSGIGRGIGLAAIGAGVVSFGKSVVESLTNYEYFSASIRTLMYGDALAAKALQSQLIDLAAKTPFKLVDVQEGSKQLLAYGFSAGSVVENMKMLGDVSTAVGKPLTEITYLYGTLKTQGRAFSKDINQFTTAGINLLPQLAKQFGVTQDAIMGPKGLVESGKVGFKDIEKAFQAMTREGGQFFGMMTEQSKTVGGKISNLGDAWEQLKVNIGKSQSGIIAGTVSFFGNLISEISKGIDKQNKLEETMSKKQAGGKVSLSGFSYLESSPNLRRSQGLLAAMAGEGGAIYDRALMKQSSLEKQIQSASGQGIMAETSLHKLMLSVSQEITKLVDSPYKRMISPRESNVQVAILKAAQDQITGALSLIKSPEKKAEETAKAEEKARTDVTELNGGKPQNLYITINDGVGNNMKIETTNVTEASGEIRDIVSKALLEAVNDVNNLAR